MNCIGCQGKKGKQGQFVIVYSFSPSLLSSFFAVPTAILAFRSWSSSIYSPLFTSSILTISPGIQLYCSSLPSFPFPFPFPFPSPFFPQHLYLFRSKSILFSSPRPPFVILSTILFSSPDALTYNLCLALVPTAFHRSLLSHPLDPPHVTFPMCLRVRVFITNY